MLKIGSLVHVNDNSGAFTIKLLNLKKKKNYLSSWVTVSDIVLGVVKDFDLHKKKKLTGKDVVTLIIVCVKKKYSKRNGIYINFSENRGLPLKITRFIVPLALRVYTPLFYELKFLKKFKVVVTSAPSIF